MKHFPLSAPSRLFSRAAAAATLIIYICAGARGQQLEWSVRANGFFDNREYSSPYAQSQTLDGLWLQPSVALRWDERHSIHAGFGGMAEWGSKKNLEKPTLELYYEYSTRPLRFLFGSFSRDEMRGDWPVALIADSVRYHDPMIEGFLFQHFAGAGYIEAFIDWTGSRSRERREQFMAGASGLAAKGIFEAGFQGYYYHYARRWNAPADEYVRDYGVANLFFGLNLSGKTPLDSLNLRFGALADIERDRKEMSNWSFNPGFLFEATATWRNLYLKNTFYAGRGQQTSGPEGTGEWYWADSFFRSSVYNRSDFLFRFIHNAHVNAYLGASAHVDDKGTFSWQQRVAVAISLGNMKGKHTRLPLQP